MTTITLADIHKKAEALSGSRDALTQCMAALEAVVTAARAEAMPAIRRSLRQVSKQQLELQQLIKDNPGLFEKPRTHIAAGLKYGYRKQRGKMTWEDDAKVVERIRALAAAEVLTVEQAEMLIATTEKPVAKSLEALDGKLLKRLGVTVGADSDQVVIASVDGELEKAVANIIKDATRDAASDANAEAEAA